MAEIMDDTFLLYDLRVEVVADEGAKIYCGANVGDYFELRGEMLHLPAGQGISIYSLASVLPLLAAKQRPTQRATPAGDPVPVCWATKNVERTARA